MANKYFRKTLIPSAATETVILEVPSANTAIVRSLRVTNTGSSPTDISVTQYVDGVMTGNSLQKERPLGAKTTQDVFNGVPCVLEEGDELKVTASSTGVHFYLSYMEVDRT